MEKNNENSKIMERLVLKNSLSKWHWFIVIGTALGTIVEGLVPHSFGTLIANFKSPSMINQSISLYSASQFQLDWLPALSSAFPCIFLPLFALLVNKWNRFYQLFSGLGFLITFTSLILSSFINNWVFLLITYSFLYSLGSSIFLAVVIITSAEYFPINHKFHVLATSIYQIGYPTAALIGNPTLAYFIVNFGWKNSFRFVSLLDILFGLMIAIIMKPIKTKGICDCRQESSNDLEITEQQIINEESEKKPLKQSFKYIIRSYQTWPWLLGKYFNYMCWYGLRTNIVTYLVKSKSFGLTNSAILMSIYAASEISIALIASLVGDKFRGWLIHIHIFATSCLAILTGIYPFVLFNYTSAVFLMISIGITIQLTLSFGYPASVEVWNSRIDMKIGWILTNWAAGLGILTSPFISGKLMDYFSINYLLYAQCFGWILQTIIFTITLLIMKYNRNKSDMSYQKIP